jgi:hypothetical protein
MAHAHVHHEDKVSYYLEQLSTIGVCGALGAVGIMMYRQEMLNFILAPAFHKPVLVGGIALVVLAAVRAVTLLISAESAHHHHHEHGHDCGHDHAHGHDCGHEHEHKHEHTHDCGHHHEHQPGHDCGHEHHHHETESDENVDVEHSLESAIEHGHAHGWSPWRYAILLLPIVLYFLNLPNQGFSAAVFEKLADPAKGLDTGSQEVAAKGTGVIPLEFKELERAASTAEQRQYYEGQSGRLVGQFNPSRETDKVFSLVRFKITCCAADAVPLKVAIVSPEPVLEVQPLQWVEVTGQIQFRKLRDKEEYLPVLQLKSKEQIESLSKPPANPYLSS